jgi:hypothetical protein
MDFDAFTAGIEDGGLRSTASISIMICYIVANSKEKITAQNIIDAMVIGKIANYFEVSDAIAKQIKVGNLTEDADGFIGITDKCRQSVEIVETDLPYTIREKSVELVRKLAKEEIYRKENKVEIEPCSGQFRVTMHVSDKDSDFMVLSLIVPTEAQAEVIKDKFLTHPSEVYENLINGIFS